MKPIKRPPKTLRPLEAGAWQGWFDGAAAPSNPGPRGAGALLVSPDGVRFEISKATGFGTNNEAEYQALIALLEAAVEHGVSHLIVCGDSQLVINQVTGDWECKARSLHGFMSTALSLVKRIRKCELRWIPRDQNLEADRLSTMALGVLGEEGFKKPGESSVWGTQTQIGKRLQVSAISVGKLLDAAGLREGKLASQIAIDAGLARQYETAFGVKTEWHVINVAEELK